MPDNKKRKSGAKVSLNSLARSVGLLRSEIRISNQEVQTGLTQIRDEMRTGFDQLYRHIDGFVKLHDLEKQHGGLISP